MIVQLMEHYNISFLLKKWKTQMTIAVQRVSITHQQMTEVVQMYIVGLESVYIKDQIPTNLFSIEEQLQLLRLVPPIQFSMSGPFKKILKQ